MTLLAEPDLNDLYSVVDQVWTTFLAGAEPFHPDFDASGHRGFAEWHSAITVTGEWEAVIVIEMTDSSARVVTERLLGMTPDEVATSDDIVDSLGELVNIIGGNVKSIMPGPSKLSLPLVAQGTVSIPVPGGGQLRESCCLDLLWADQPLRVVVSSISNPS